MTATNLTRTAPTAIRVDPQRLADLRRRLDQTSIPASTATTATPGFGPDQIAAVLTRFRDEFEWEQVEQRLDDLGQLIDRTSDGKRLHSLHAPGGNRLPVLLIHGWPDSPLRFAELIPRLVAAGHPVVAPSIPGFGFSEQPDGEISREYVAGEFAALMKGLGYQRYAVHGGDWGSLIARSIAESTPDSVAALHLSDVPFDLVFSVDKDSASEAETAYLTKIEQAGDQLYLQANTSQPDLLALALNDSPAALAAWLADRYAAWSQDPIEIDHVLANAALLWLTDSVRSSLRLYSEPQDAWGEDWESAGAEWEKGAQDGDGQDRDGQDWDGQDWDGQDRSGTDDDAASAGNPDGGSWVPARLAVPSAFALFPKDLSMAPRELAERFFDVQRFTIMPRGGHFAALEQPDLLAEDLIAFLADKQ